MTTGEHNGLDSHRHPTFGVCLCGHLDFMHPWERDRIEYQGPCIAKVQGTLACACKGFHADPLSRKDG